ncbi:MAG: SPOR domain-containing protein, partial [bacterium]
SERESEEFSEVEEEDDWEEEDTWTPSRRSLLLIGLLCVIFGILVSEDAHHMQLAVKIPQLAGERIISWITSNEKEEEPGISRIGGEGKTSFEGGKQDEERPTVSERPIMVEEREADRTKVFILGEKEVPKEGKEIKDTEVEGTRSRVEGEGEGKAQVVMVEKPKGLTPPEGEPPEGKYTVNIASFRKRDRAERLVKELEEKGYEPFMEKASTPQEGTWYRVAVGRFSSREKAQAFARGLREKGIEHSYVRRLQ